MGDNATLAAEYARGLSGILVALAESPNIPTPEVFCALSALTDKIAETAATPDAVAFRKAAQ